jgi:hypothetical protein
VGVEGDHSRRGIVRRNGGALRRVGRAATLAPGLKLFFALCPFGRDPPTRALPSRSRSRRRRGAHIGRGRSCSIHALRQFLAQSKALRPSTALHRRFLETTRSTPILEKTFRHQVIRITRAEGSIARTPTSLLLFSVVLRTRAARARSIEQAKPPDCVTCEHFELVVVWDACKVLVDDLCRVRVFGLLMGKVGAP